MHREPKTDGGPSSPSGPAASSRSAAPIDTDVLVVGAGPAGLAVTRCLRERGVRADVVDGLPAAGASWRAHYERLHLHTDRDRSGLPYAPWPKSAPRYPARDEVVAYLERYAAQLDPPPRFGVVVHRAARALGGWTVDAGATTLRARALVVATGMCAVPHRPTFDGEASFGGVVLHSSDYQSGARFAGQRVLVVGFGNSGGEIAVDLVEQGAQAVRMAVRSPVNIVAREFLGTPILAAGDMLAFLPTRVADAIARALRAVTVGDLRKLGLVPADNGPRAQLEATGRVPLIDIGTIAMMKRGAIEVRPGIAAFVADGVRFTDGRTEPFDAVVLATGFRPRLDRFLQGEPLDEVGGPARSGVVEGDPPLAFCGLRPSSRGMLRSIGEEASAVAAELAGWFVAREGPQRALVAP